MIDQNTCRMLGLTFTRMTERDYDGFAGMDRDGFIARVDDNTILIFVPETNELHEFDCRGDDTVEVVWARSAQIAGPKPLTLEELREIPHGEHLDESDLQHANTMLEAGQSRAYVMRCADGWAAEYARVQAAETAAAIDFEDAAYGPRD